MRACACACVCSLFSFSFFYTLYPLRVCCEFLDPYLILLKWVLIFWAPVLINFWQPLAVRKIIFFKYFLKCFLRSEVLWVPGYYVDLASLKKKKKVFFFPSLTVYAYLDGQSKTFHCAYWNICCLRYVKYIFILHNIFLELQRECCATKSNYFS